MKRSPGLLFALLPLLAPTLLLAPGVAADENPFRGPSEFWSEGRFHQESIDLSRLDEGVIKARVDGTWREYANRELPEAFATWSFGRRRVTLERLGGKEPPQLSGPHNAMVASHGAQRGDSEFAINNAVKGMGWLPRPEKLAEVIGLLEATAAADFPVKLATLDSLYALGTEVFDPRCQVSLELYSTPEFETGSFINQMTSPACAVVFLDIPSFEFKALVHLLHPEDARLSAVEKLQSRYVNLVHSYIHGDFDRRFIAAVYYVIEVYDNSPGKPDARGRRVVPALPTMP